MARIPRPSRDDATSQLRATTSPIDTTRITIWTRVTCAPATSYRVSGNDSAGKRRVSGPNRHWSSAITMPASAIEEISPAKCASGRSFNGRNATRSMIRPRMAPTTNTIGKATQIDSSPTMTSSMPTNAAAVNTAGCARFSRSRMPNTSVNPIANRA